MPYRIYSIESRKGGVGKTTVALNLACILAKKGLVLLLDCDITGTSIVDPAKNSSFWNDETNVLTYVDKNGEMKDLNLIQFFLERFIKGEGNARDIIKQEKLMTGKVNVIGSFLYGTPHEAAVNVGWLMDELHSYWMVELIRQIVKEFEGLYPDKTVHVIVDNSPGYTSFNQSLHDYMYEEGPMVSKFLLVSTLDSQDLQANMEAAAEISKSINNRTIAAAYYKLKENDAKGEEKDADAETLIETDDEIKGFFFNLIEDKEQLELYSKNYDSEDYLALVLNKIPQTLQDNDTVVAYNEIIENRLDLFLRITGSTGGEPKNLVYYDEAIVYQYYLKYLRGRMRNRPVNAAYWNRRLREMSQQAAEIASLPPMTVMSRLNTYYEGLQTSLNQRGYAQIARQLVRTWSPGYAPDMLKANLSSASARRFFNSGDIPPQRIKEMLYVWNREQLREIESHLGDHASDISVLSDLMDYMEVYSGLNDEKRLPEQMILLSLLLYLFRYSFVRQEEIDRSLRFFVWSEFMNQSHRTRERIAVEKAIVVNPELTLDLDYLQRVYRMDIDRLYSNFCYTVLRLIDQNEDFQFILSAVNLYVPSFPALSFSKEMTDYISEVVYRKRLERNVDVLTNIRAKSYVMKNMQDVLRENVLKTWK